ncbi:Crp/Fnr family transcriptional regulator [Ornithinimicrobium tianjinense]|uniref:Crp/Fnr family transcriptional regulator n=1 Tax=Ornithinimicrobium tianjinense TaxID=1195761 RepID=A0A917F261_9MICO|nr:Crp/Fnr family transcriptional regulator [Ornithinimicrobium tianjinense]GGF41011.1 Crp/Fnr family transcriptional regulator [Ornithinimicrobium tianjinense]
MELPLAQDDLCVARVPLFRGLTRTEQEHVAALARPTRITRGEALYIPGADVSQLMVVHTGRLKISRVGVDGREQVVRVLEPGDFVGESAFLTGARPDHQAVALEDGSLCVFRHGDVAALVREHPSIGLHMLQELSRRLEETEARLASVVSLDVSARLADYLLGLPARRSADGLTVRLPLAKKDIASLLGTTPESLSRQLRRLAEAGLVSEHGPGLVTIADVDGLLALSGDD